MPKTIRSEIFDAEIKREMWLDISRDNQALKDRGKTQSEARQLACYFEGKADGFRESMYYNN